VVGVSISFLSSLFQMEEFLGNPDNRRIISLGVHLFNSILVDGRGVSCLKVVNNEVSIDEHLMPFECA
jgi:hypothetical protein